MVTHGNGELCSKPLHSALNRSYIRRLKVFYSCARHHGLQSVSDYVEKDGTFIKQCPPLGDTIRDMWDKAASSANNAWGISDFERNTREMQGVKCCGIFAQDHTFEPAKNYQKQLGATAAWDVATDTGEIATVVLVKTTKTTDFSHAAKQLLRRPGFNPTAMCSDTWPHKSAFWSLMCPGAEGRLGLFHFEKRIISTMRKKHCDYFQAITDLSACLCVYCTGDYEKLLTALKDGSLSPTNKKYSSNEISDLKQTRFLSRLTCAIPP